MHIQGPTCFFDTKMNRANMNSSMLRFLVKSMAQTIMSENLELCENMSLSIVIYHNLHVT